LRRSAAAQQVCVRDDHQFAAAAADTGALDADVLHHARDGIDFDGIARHEGLVEGDGKAGEEIAEHVLHRQRDGDAADAETGEQGRDVDAEVVQRHQSDQRPDKHPRHEIDDGKRGRFRATLGPRLGQLLFTQPETQCGGGPYAALQRQQDDDGIGSQQFGTRRQHEPFAGQGEGERKQGKDLDLRDQCREQTDASWRRTGSEPPGAATQLHPQQCPRHHDGTGTRQGHQPLVGGIAPTVAASRRLENTQPLLHRAIIGWGPWLRSASFP
jgi:hypothetical protein